MVLFVCFAHIFQLYSKLLKRNCIAVMLHYTHSCYWRDHHNKNVFKTPTIALQLKLQTGLQRPQKQPSQKKKMKKSPIIQKDFLFQLFLTPRVFSPSRVFLIYVQYLAGCRDANPSYSKILRDSVTRFVYSRVEPVDYLPGINIFEYRVSIS